MNILENVTIGTDPELFIINTKTNKVVSSVGLIPGFKKDAYVPTKKDGTPFPEGFGLEIDNILAEFNIPPVKTQKNFIANINKMKDFIKNFVKEKNPDLDILCKASENVDDDQLQSKEAKLFGCCPDFNVYTMSENIAPKGNMTNLRSTGELLAR